MKYLIVIIGLLIFSSCEESSELKKEKNAQSEISKNNVVTEQDVSNKPIYNIAIGDTVKIYHSYTSGLEISRGLSMEKLNHVEYDGVLNIDTGNSPYCEGCTITIAYLLIGSSVGTDTIFDKLEGCVIPEMDTLTSFSHIIHIK